MKLEASRPACQSAARRIPRGQDLVEVRHLLPRRYRGQVARARGVGRRLEPLHSMDVARAVGKDALRPHPPDRLGTCELGKQDILKTKRSTTVYPQAARLLEIEEH